MTNTHLPITRKLIALSVAQKRTIFKGIRLRKSRSLFCFQKTMSLWVTEKFELQQLHGKGTMSRILKDPKLQADQSAEDGKKLLNRLRKDEELNSGD